MCSDNKNKGQLISIIQQFIKKEQLLQHDKRQIVAVSGGADSVALLLILKKLGYQLDAAHCNFHLRGEESDHDETFVVELCRQNDIPLHRIHFDTHTYASLHHVSIEMAARELRYRYFEQLRKDIGAAAICVAHHRDDSVETVLINLVRGTGIHGLTGIQPRQGNIVRPLLAVGRHDIEAYLKHIGQPYVTDSTNLKDDVVRNKIRLRILPLLRELNPSVTESIMATARHLAEVERVYNDSVTRSLSEIATGKTLSIAKLLNCPSPESVLFEYLRSYGFTPATIQQIFSNLQSPTGRLWSSSSHELIINRGLLIIEPVAAAFKPLRIPETGVYRLEWKERDEEGITEGKEHEEGHLAKLRIALGTDLRIDKNRYTATLDASKVTFPLTLRTVQQSDRFIPFGMTGSKLVSDYLTDLKQTLFERRRQLVLTEASGNIIWLVGHRPDARYCITPSTNQTLVISLL